MRMSKTLAATLAAAVALPALSAAPAIGQPRDHDRDYGWHGDDQNWEPSEHWDHRRHHERRLGRDDVVYRGRDGRYYCKRSDGTTGLVIGGITGAVVGNAAGHGNTLGTLLGAVGGAALGRSIDRGHVRCR